MVRIHSWWDEPRMRAFVMTCDMDEETSTPGGIAQVTPTIHAGWGPPASAMLNNGRLGGFCEHWLDMDVPRRAEGRQKRRACHPGPIPVLAFAEHSL